MSKRHSNDLWEKLGRFVLLKELFSGPVIIGFSALTAMLSQREPFISALGWFGMICTGLGACLVLSLCAWLQSKAFGEKRTADKVEEGRIYKIVHWWGWQWLFLAVCLIVSCLFIDSRPRLPSWEKPGVITMPIASYREMQKEKVVGRTVLINEVPRDSQDPMHIKNKIFEHCVILGPAVLALTHTLMVSCELQSWKSADDILLESKSNIGIGILTADHCGFNQCQFVFITFAGNEQTIDQIRKAANYDHAP
jgi:MFS family permease